MDGQTWRRLKQIAIVFFAKLDSLTVFQSSFLLFVTFDLTLGRHVCSPKCCYFEIYK